MPRSKLQLWWFSLRKSMTINSNYMLSWARYGDLSGMKREYKLTNLVQNSLLSRQVVKSICVIQFSNCYQSPCPNWYRRFAYRISYFTWLIMIMMLWRVGILHIELFDRLILVASYGGSVPSRTSQNLFYYNLVYRHLAPMWVPKHCSLTLILNLTGCDESN